MWYLYIKTTSLRSFEEWILSVLLLVYKDHLFRIMWRILSWLPVYKDHLIKLMKIFFLFHNLYNIIKTTILTFPEFCCITSVYLYIKVISLPVYKDHLINIMWRILFVSLPAYKDHLIMIMWKIFLLLIHVQHTYHNSHEFSKFLCIIYSIYSCSTIYMLSFPLYLSFHIIICFSFSISSYTFTLI